MRRIIAPKFCMGEEVEYLTALRDPSRRDSGEFESQFFDATSKLTPTISASAGVFSMFGRHYFDSGHLELATAECRSPFDVELMRVSQEHLARHACCRDDVCNESMVIADVGYGGILAAGSPAWGCHENYLVTRNPADIATAVVPFFATRCFLGAGGMDFQQDAFVGSPRLRFLERDIFPGYNNGRALAARGLRDNYAGSDLGYFRYHCTAGDSNRSKFSRCLRLGATALVLAAAVESPDAFVPLKQWIAPDLRRRSFWMRAVERFNHFASLGQPLRVDAWSLRVQRLFLDATRRYADRCVSLPDWTEVIFEMWESTLGAITSDDQPWLAERLDPWIKYRFLTEFIDELGATWDEAATDLSLGSRLAVVNQGYHEFVGPLKIFQEQCEGGLVAPEAVPSPPLGFSSISRRLHTRADARAKIIADLWHCDDVTLGWDRVRTSHSDELIMMPDPFDTQLPCQLGESDD
ncbi:proteasome accessory factor PafA2 family protein [Stratiformator vulcanicus]|uniref:Pup--protein ligase n=1 Tax=Stratiformator vulcanicus TaxID=2527980 RepID=A0A517QWM4_9PLAN|nr:proteasome accessory factor PafA2 family protein [Stratiformator vulcanicus]QDT36004.1 Pup--protein ligase [Stratiformator vulcanicus]